MPDKTVYIGLFDRPLDPTQDTTATFQLGPANSPGNKWPRNSVITTTLDGGPDEVREVDTNADALYVYEGLAVGTHTWHASVVGDDILPADNDPGFTVTWTIEA